MGFDVTNKGRIFALLASFAGAVALLIMLPGIAMADGDLPGVQEQIAQQQEAVSSDAVAGDAEDVLQGDATDSTSQTPLPDGVEGEQPGQSDANATDELPGSDVVDESGDEVVADDADLVEVEAPTPVVEEAPSTIEPQTQEIQVQADADLSTQASQGRWFVGDLNNGYGLQRYWYGADGSMAYDRVIDPSEGSGYWAYATRFGYVARGPFDTGRGMVYLADNDGRLSAANGWLITSAYDGNLQRYYVDPVSKAARSSYFTVDGANYYGKGGVGYVLRGFDGARLANNDGMLTSNTWVVTADFGQGLQRYWFDSKGAMAVNRVIEASEAGFLAFATPSGYVVRGTFDTGRGMVYLANNDGVMAASQGWIVTADFTPGTLQRYYIDPVTHAARSGFFTVDGYGECFGMAGAGYLLRGTTGWYDHLLIADNDGRMYSGDAGWAVTASLAGSKQRYWFDNVWSHYKGARIGFFTIGSDSYYGREDFGYVARSPYINPSGLVYMGNNDGKLTMTSWLSNVGRQAWGKILGVDSKTQYLISIACDDCHVVIFEGSAGRWVPIADVLAGTGLDMYNGGQGTVRGIFEIGGNDACYNWADWISGRDNYHGDYRVEYYPKDDIYYFTGFLMDLGLHSTIPSMGSAESQLGHKVSHGCVRLNIQDAKWIYYNCAPGTRVVSY